MEFITTSALNGIIYGLLLFMVSAGLTLIFGMMGVLNFAHASFYMLGAYFAYTLSSHFNFWVGILVAPILVGGIGIIIERYMLRKVHAYGHAHELLLTFGLAFIADETIKLFYGNVPVNYRVPEFLNFPAFTIFSTTYPFYRILIGAVAVVMFAVLFLLLKRTRVGIVVRAAERLPKMAQGLGHNVPLVFMGVFGIGALLAGLAGAVAGAFYPTNPNMAAELGVIVFVVVVVGGLGSLAGSLVASLMIGIFSSFAVGLNWSVSSALSAIGLGGWIEGSTGLISAPISSIAGAVPFLLMLIILMVRPAGLMGSKN
jgi:branched-chain amino acid transport system permease protein